MIFVFSRTGNSYSVARRISKAVGVGIADIAAVARYKHFGYDAGGRMSALCFPCITTDSPS